MQVIHGLVRKAAHVTEYAVLALLVARALAGSGSPLWPIWAVLLVSVTALADEINQGYNPQRTGSGWDVVLDISGGLLGLVLFWFWTGRQKRSPPGGGVERI